MILKAVLLQTPSVLLDSQPVSLPVKRAEALLYYMLVRKSASRQELISLLWEDCDEATGLKNLRNTLYSLRKALGGDLLLSPRKSLLVVNEAWEIDCDYDLLVRDRVIPENRGEFLQGFSLKRAFAFEEWIRSVRERTREIFLEELLRINIQPNHCADGLEGITQHIMGVTITAAGHHQALAPVVHQTGLACFNIGFGSLLVANIDVLAILHGKGFHNLVIL